MAKTSRMAFKRKVTGIHNCSKIDFKGNAAANLRRKMIPYVYGIPDRIPGGLAQGKKEITLVAYKSTQEMFWGTFPPSN